MASVFLSYDREDTAKARRLALALEKAGHEVWWDLHVRGGAQFSKVIEEALKAADAVVVLWSARSIESPWVRDEAAAGRDSGRLIPVSLDNTEPPLGFRQFQTIDLSGWKGRGRCPHLQALHAAIVELNDNGSQKAETPRQAHSDGADAKRRRHLLLAGVAVLAIMAIVGTLFLLKPWAGRAAPPVVAVVAAGQGAASKALARDLFVQLGRLQATNPNALQLVGTASERPDFILEASSGVESNEVNAALVLLSGKNRHLLWSKNYSQPSASQAELQQQLAYSAASVLACAAEASAATRPLSDELRETYLNGCSEFAESGGANPSLAAVVHMFEKVARENPRFRPAWAKLLIAESNLAVQTLATTGSDAEVKPSLRRHIADARRHHGAIPEMFIAEIELLPEGSYAERLRLADAARDLEPDNANALLAHAYALSSVGRSNEAISHASRAIELVPLSPAVRNAYINALAYGGRVDAAAEALAEAERIWPGTASVADAKFRFHLRYGDPTVAMEIYRSQRGTSRLHQATMLARFEPTSANIERAAALARSLLVRFGDVAMYSQILAELGLEEEVYATISRAKDPLPRSSTEVYFRPTLKKFREDPRFMVLAKRLGLLDYWRSSRQWPDFCFEPDLPYDCKAEAAKTPG